MKNNTTRPVKGLNTDSSPQDQAKDTYRFALNAIMESGEGDLGFIGNEEANEDYTNIPEDYIIIGSCYIGDEQTALFLVKEDESLSEIGILDKDKTYTTSVNTDVLTFKIYHQIDSVYRLRRGCDKTLYFTDGYNKPRVYNLSSPEDFKTNGNWDADKFSLFKTFSQIPLYSEILIKETQGSLEPGSYNFAVRYLDEDLNPTEWTAITDTVIIYNDSVKKPYSEIHGSTTQTASEFLSDVAVEEDSRLFYKTNKAIELFFSFLDDDYPLYQVAVISANSGNGIVSSVQTSSTISTKQKSFLFTGDNAPFNSTEEEINVFNNIIEKADHIEQLENRLVLANTKGKDIGFCNLQKYASKIVVNMKPEEILLTSPLPDNPKTAEIHNDKIGYMPGEIYSFGIVYIFKDNTVSPVYHIPGKNESDTSTNMGGENTLNSSTYISLNNCEEEDYWGKDSQGEFLVNKKVRHHRFPTRTEASLPLVVDSGGGGLAAAGDLTNLETENNLLQSYFDNNTENNQYGVRFCLKYSIIDLTDSLNPTTEVTEVFSIPIGESDENGVIDMSFFLQRLTSSSEGLISTVAIYEAKPSIVEIPFLDTSVLIGTSGSVGEWNKLETPTGEPFVRTNLTGSGGDTITFSVSVTSSFSNIKYTWEESNATFSQEGVSFKGNIMGATFSNIELPLIEDSKEEIIGYYIVRNERTEDKKTILDSAILTPISVSSNFASFGFLTPKTTSSLKVSEDTFHMLSLENLYNKKSYNPSKLLTDGVFWNSAGRIGGIIETLNKVAYNSFSLQDVSGSPDDTSNSNETDDDGFDLQVRGRMIGPTYLIPFQNFVGLEDEYFSQNIKNISSIDSAQSVYISNMKVDNQEKDIRVYNVSTDNRANIVNISEKRDYWDKQEDSGGAAYAGGTTYPYVYLKNNLGDRYSTFTEDPYYVQQLNPTYFNSNNISETDIFRGDVYISSLTYLNSFLINYVQKKREQNSGTFDIILGSLATVGGVILAFTPAAPAAGLVISAGLTKLSTGLEKDKLKQLYNKLYREGLANTVKDGYTGSSTVFKDGEGVEDSEIQWFADTLKDVWLESTVNGNWRLKLNNFPCFINSPKDWENDIWRDHMLEKLLTVVDNTRKGGRLFKDYASAEIYEVNLDYARREKQKPNFTLPTSFDCCSDCQESFPHRVAYSTQSFQEEQVDNYRVFLPNNYRDIEGETGEITNLVRIQNNLYIQTEEGLWNLPQSFQERITSDIVSFIGTGEFFSVPPRKITDDNNGMSAGTIHKWATVKFPGGVFFISEKQGTVWIFNGTSLQPISINGMNSFFKNNLRSKYSESYYEENKEDYPYDNNPSNPEGTGFIATYDSRYERILLTKKDFIEKDGNKLDNSWTLSYSLKYNSWTSFHSYMPNMYIHTPDRFFSWKVGNNVIWKHNVPNKFQNYYGSLAPFIVEYVSLSNPLETKIWDSLKLYTEAKKYDNTTDSTVDERFITFNKLIAYNTRQTTGEVNLEVKDTNVDQANYLMQQVASPTPGTILIDRNERDWNLNDLRDVRVDYTKPIFDKSITARQNEYYIDKVLNASTIDFNKPWNEVESFRDKYLVLRLIFDNFDDVKLILNYSAELEKPSFR